MQRREICVPFSHCPRPRGAHERVEDDGARHQQARFTLGIDAADIGTDDFGSNVASLAAFHCAARTFSLTRACSRNNRRCSWEGAVTASRIVGGRKGGGGEVSRKDILLVSHFIRTRSDVIACNPGRGQLLDRATREL